MKLKEKFLPKMYCFFGSGMLTNTYDENVANTNAVECERIADEYAIEFTDWCEDNYFASSGRKIWYDQPDFESANRYTTEELLQIFKKTKYEN